MIRNKKVRTIFRHINKYQILSNKSNIHKMNNLKSQFYAYALEKKGEGFAQELLEILDHMNSLPFTVTNKKRVPNEESDTPQNSKEKKTKRKKKSNKNRNGKPKRGRTAYILFSMASRKELSKNLPELKGKKIMTRIGEMWRKTSDEDKRPFVEESKEEMDRYKRAMVEWKKKSSLNSDGDETEQTDEETAADVKSVKQTNKAKQTKKAKKTGNKKKPKRAITAYIAFSNSKRAEAKEQNPNVSHKDIMKILGGMWKNASPEEREPFVIIAREDKIRYEKEKDEMAEVVTATVIANTSVANVSETTTTNEKENVEDCKNVDDGETKESAEDAMESTQENNGNNDSDSESECEEMEWTEYVESEDNE